MAASLALGSRRFRRTNLRPPGTFDQACGHGEQNLTQITPSELGKRIVEALDLLPTQSVDLITTRDGSIILRKSKEP